MKIKNYNQYINEGIISKGLELINYKTIKENDKISNKYFKMIYDNYQKNKNLMAVKISLNKGYSTLWYKISDDTLTRCGTSGGHFPNYIEVEITSINETGWDSDITRARIQVRKNGKLLIGRDMKSNKNIISDDGINQDAYSYLNISQAQVDKMIKFFKSEYIKKYPEMSSFSAFNHMRILEIDKELLNSIKKRDEDKKEEHLSKRKNIESKFHEIIDKDAKFQHEDIYDYFIDLVDHMDDTIIDSKPSIGISTIIDNELITLVKNIKSKISVFKDGCFYYNSDNNLINDIHPNKIYYYIDFNTSYPIDDDDSDGSGYIGPGSINYKYLSKFVEEKYNLSMDKKLNSNRTFKLINIGDENPIMKSHLDNIQFVILLEQI